MSIGWQEQLRPGIALTRILQQATAALISMDAERLEELARCCADLNREIEETGETAEAAITLRNSENDMKLLGRVLYETRANLTVLSRLHIFRLREVDALHRRYDQGQPSSRAQTLEGMVRAEKVSEYGDN